jgi:hypothetical protein
MGTVRNSRTVAGERWTTHRVSRGYSVLLMPDDDRPKAGVAEDAANRRGLGPDRVSSRTASRWQTCAVGRGGRSRITPAAAVRFPSCGPSLVPSYDAMSADV